MPSPPPAPWFRRAAPLVAAIACLLARHDTAAQRARTRPAVTVPSGPRPTSLQVNDRVVGRGAPMRAGARVTVHYVGVAWSTGQTFDASWESGRPFAFTVGAGEVIAGWDQGLVGMRVGGRRELIVPPELGYGARGSMPAIRPHETLIFVIDLLARR